MGGVNPSALPRQSSLYLSPIARADPKEASLVAPSVAVFVLLPVVSLVFPELLSSITNFDVTAIDRQTSILQLLLLKRVYLYGLALAALDWCSKRSAELVDVPLGSRFLAINQELLSGLGNGTDSFASLEKEANRPLYEALDKVEGSQQAAALPILLAASLACSFAFLTISSRLSIPPPDENVGDTFALAQALGSSLLAGFSVLSNGAVSFLFSKAELQVLRTRWTPQLPSETATVVAAVLCIAAFAGGLGSSAWPAQNAINVMLAVTACRACALPRIRFIIPALVGLMLYDFVAVSGTAQFTDGGSSIMEAVAVAKVTAAGSTSSATSENVVAAVAGVAASPWRPGLFQVVVSGRVSDALGLADVIFPALLAGWALRFDNLQKQEQEQDPEQGQREQLDRPQAAAGLYPAALFGFVIGCFSLELLQTGAGGQPALIYLVPAMLLSVFAAGAKAGALGRMWAL